MIERALAAGVPFRWVAADSVYGVGDIERNLRQAGKGYAYDAEHKHIIIADPYRENPISKNNYYSVKVHSLINAILLGIITYDANFLIIEPKK